MKDAQSRGEHYGTFPPLPGLPEQYLYEWTVHVGYPGYMVLTGPNCALWYRLLPVSAQKIQLITTILVHPDAKNHPDYEAHLATETQALKEFHLEDVEVCTSVQRGLNSETFQHGRFSYLEKPVFQIQQYLADQIRRTGNGFTAPAPEPVSA
jgi:phenylpropionate dioxygenase-like ring-hydroxylating dioxygenase large terminal subunit